MQTENLKKNNRRKCSGYTARKRVLRLYTKNIKRKFNKHSLSQLKTFTL